MRILVYPHDLEIGGSQLNAIDLAAGVRDLGHDVLVFGEPGPLTGRIRELGLEWIPATAHGIRPSPAIVRSLRRLVISREVDVIHGYEWPPSIDATLAAMGTPAVAVSTVMSMSVAPFIPRFLPLVVGTHAIAETEEALGRTMVSVIEPPVDVDLDDPDLDVDASGFRSLVGAEQDSLLIVTVCRLAQQLKLEGLLTAIGTIPELPQNVQLVLVGDGPARDSVRRAATSANGHAGRRAVIVAGAMADPRPAYAAADIVLGMGGSALRALSFAKPVIVQGERGFWELVTPDSVDQFLWNGWFGLGAGEEASRIALERALAPVLADAALRAQLGKYGRGVVEERFSLEAASARQLSVYETALATRSRVDVPEILRSTTSFAGHAVSRKIRRRFGGGARDDFNVQNRLISRPSPGADNRPVTRMEPR